ALLYVRKPLKWGYGVIMFLLLSIGSAIHFTVPVENDFPAAIRLAQIAAIFFLIALAFRYSGNSTNDSRSGYSEKVSSSANSNIPKSDTPQQSLVRDFLTLASTTDNKKVCVLLTQIIAQTTPADVCILLSPPELNKQFVVLCGYDLIREEQIAGNSRDAEDLPRLASAANRKKSLRLSSDSKSPDMHSLQELLMVESIGGVLAAPIVSSKSSLIAYLILASPYANKNWFKQDETYLNEISPMIAGILERASGEFFPQEETLGSMPIIYPGLEGDVEENVPSHEVQTEVVELNNAIEDLQRKVAEKDSTIQGMETLLLSSDSDTSSSTELEQEVDNLKLLLAQANQNSQAPEVDTSETNQLKEHLAQAQSHIQELKAGTTESDQLKGKLTHAHSKLQELESALAAANEDADAGTAKPAPAQALSLEQAELIASIAQDVRQPLSSVSGYTDLLLGESVGILGALQRKFLDRVKTATDRMNGLIDNLIQITALDSGNIELTTESVKLSSVIDDAIGQTSSQMREKDIILRVDLPDELPSLSTDRDSLQQILLHLIQNAGASSPESGEISLSAHVEDDEQTNNKHVLIQVTDTGGGIAEDDLPRVFSRLYRADNPLIDGVGDTGVGLSIAKALTEALGGRIWVESEIEVGSTFSVSLPLPQLETAGSSGDN
ncbi:MAG: ATP-binding protein, partial [Chloroflexota bacterium]